MGFNGEESKDKMSNMEDMDSDYNSVPVTEIRERGF